MTDRTELLAAILADPACDVKRLAYADLLEDSGEVERAEYIRLAINNPHPDQFCQCDVCRKEVRMMCGFFEPLCPWPGDDNYRVDRGFISALRGPLASLLEHGPAIVAVNPVERVEVTDKCPENGGGGLWEYYTDYGHENSYVPSFIPNRVMRKMPFENRDGGTSIANPNIRMCSFMSRQEAIDALNTAGLAELRRRAGVDATMTSCRGTTSEHGPNHAD